MLAYYRRRYAGEAARGRRKLCDGFTHIGSRLGRRLALGAAQASLAGALLLAVPGYLPQSAGGERVRIAEALKGGLVDFLIKLEALTVKEYCLGTAIAPS